MNVIKKLIPENQTKPLRALIVEDSQDDVVLLLHELRRGGYEPEYELVDNEQDMRRALESRHWDIVITDHRLPNFSSHEALSTAAAYNEDIPVIVVSGSIGENCAVNIMRLGANDFILKDNLTRLVAVIERELREAASRRARKHAEDTVLYLRNHDALTGLNNRVEFEHRLHTALDQVKSLDLSCAVLYVDLDQFKIVNDICGHVAGDELLKAVTVEMSRLVKGKDTLARMGGDEFGVLLERYSLSEARTQAEKLLDAIKNYRFEWDGKSFAISASIGLVMLSSSYDTYHDVLSAADIACYAAKDLGRNRVKVYRKDDNALIQRHGEMSWVARINHALENDMFMLEKQKIVSLQTADSSIPAYEFLVRIKNDDGTITMPCEFIPAAERYNLMESIDRWVIDKVFNILSQAISRGRLFTCFINLSGNSLNDDQIYDYIQAKLRQYVIPPNLICFEITETAAISNLNQALGFIEAIKGEGCFLALDDFGAGLSSYSYLKSLPVDFLKIDGSFIVDLMRDDMDMAIVESIARIGHVAGLGIIAEFVENEQVRDLLSSMGIDYAQGYGIEQPISV